MFICLKIAAEYYRNVTSSTTIGISVVLLFPDD